MKKFLLTLILATFSMNGELKACQRFVINSDFLIAMADQVFVGKVYRINKPDTVKVTVTKTLKGQQTKQVEISHINILRKDFSNHCGGIELQTNEEYIFATFGSDKALSLKVVNSSDAVILASEKNIEMLGKIVENRGPHSPWKSNQTLISTKLIAKKSTYKSTEDLDLQVLIRNNGDKPLSFNYIDWPSALHTFCELNVIGANGTAVKPVKAIQDSAINDYFPKYGRKYSIEIKPGQFYHFQLPRISTKSPGMGYKEELNFSFYPVQQGEYKISASCEKFFNIPITTDEIKVTVKD